MDSTALEIRDIFGLADDRAEKAASLFGRIAKRASHAETAERIEARVEKEVAKEVKVLEARSEAYATKSDPITAVASLKEDMHAMETNISGKIDSLLKWTVSILISILLAAIAVVIALRSSPPTPSPQVEIPK